MFKLLVIILSIIHIVISEVFFEEEFIDGDDYVYRWIESTHLGTDQGKFQLSSGKHFGDIWRDKGLQTSQDSKFYGISVKFNKSIDTKDKILVIQYQLKMEDPIECGGGYIKILGSDFDHTTFHGHTPYKIMFGPDICGHDKRIVHVILNYKEKYFVIKKNIKCKDDKFSHLYTLIIFPTNIYEVLIDNIKVEGGLLSEDFDFLLPKKIKDPLAVKPNDWVDEKTIYDINDTKPNDWDQPKTVPDPKASEPKNYDEIKNGIWKPSLIKNPKYKGEWKPRNISNPKYNGSWIHPMIDNPDFIEDPELYRQTDIAGLGFDIWQVVARSILDNILITDDPEYAFENGKSTWQMAYKDEMKIHNHKKEYERKQKDEFKALSDQYKKSNYDIKDGDGDVEDEILAEQSDIKTKTEL